MATVALEAEPVEGGWSIRLVRHGRLFSKSGAVPTSQWADSGRSLAGVALLRALCESGEASMSEDAIHLTHEVAAGLTGMEVSRMGLPPVAPYAVMIERESPIGDATFRIRVSWVSRDGITAAAVTRSGSMLTVGSKRYLVLNPLCSLLDAIDDVNMVALARPDDLDARMSAFAVMRSKLTLTTGDVRADDYLGNLVIHQATGIGIDVSVEAGEESFSPILYGDNPVRKPDAGEDEPTREPLLPMAYANQFARDRFPRQGARSHYVVGQGVYVVLAAPVSAALAVVEKINKSDRKTRAEFRQDPMKFLLPALEQAGSDGSVVEELKGYGERVLGVAPWHQAKLSFKVPVSREWFPEDDAEVFTIDVGVDLPLVVRRDDVAALKASMEVAEGAGATTFQFAGKEYPYTTAAGETVRALMGVIEPQPTGALTSNASDAPEVEKAKVWAVTTLDNEEELSFSATLKQSKRHLRPDVDSIPLLSVPKRHQRDGIQWLQTAFLSGMPGVLLADDMGLGKTFQVLAFLQWLRAGLGAQGERRPFLVVAPKTLLGTWASEIETHLGPDALGRELRVYEDGLAAVRVQSKGNDTTTGTQTLRTDRIEDADLVLTTYETLRDYQLSFGRVRFAAIVYDEAQKLKNPTSLMNKGAKAQQADFTIVMTGTPIENGLIDLWTMMDILWPGLFDMSGRDFVKTYGEADASRRDELRSKLVEPVAFDGKTLQPVMLRRFKSSELEGLPTRRTQVVSETMPEIQARAYDAVLQMAAAKPGDTLTALQRLRSISLHPQLSVPVDASGCQSFVAASARFVALTKIMDQVNSRGEKVLIFVDIIEAQRALAVLLAERYGLRRPPAVINGSTSSDVRDKIRREFQARPPGFDVLLLGPKAAGFGLTLTAANHVVHLNRWWNPAVEDQCSDRVYRIGQEREVTIWLPQAIHPGLGDKSYDVLLNQLLEEKRALSRDIVVPTQMNELDFQRLYEQATGRSGASAEALEEVDKLDWRSFEKWVAHRLREAGFSVDETPRSGDGGADLLAT
jgi:hypothetical protein